jgi:hypothetical protein
MLLDHRARSDAPTMATDEARNMLDGDRNILSLPGTFAPLSLRLGLLVSHFTAGSYAPAAVQLAAMEMV